MDLTAVAHSEVLHYSAIGSARGPWDLWLCAFQIDDLNIIIIMFVKM